jgi:ribosomal protein S18 acetylase RimI-like enzyme
MRGPMPSQHLRARVDEDLDSCVALAAEVQRADGYPSFLGDGDLVAFVAPDDAIGAWVAELDGDVVGHVMLRPRSAPPSVVLAAGALDVDPQRLGFVARLMVAPHARRRGIARRLLDVVVEEAQRRRLLPVLDVVSSDVAAIELYEASGWRHLGDRRFTMRNGNDLSLRVYAWPVPRHLEEPPAQTP